MTNLFYLKEFERLANYNKPFKKFCSKISNPTQKAKISNAMHQNYRKILLAHRYYVKSIDMPLQLSRRPHKEPVYNIGIYISVSHTQIQLPFIQTFIKSAMAQLNNKK